MILRYNILPILWAILILILSIIPGEQLPEIDFSDIISIDKLAHVFMYGMLVFLLTTGCKRQYANGWLRYHAKLFAFWISLTYGITIEILQLLINTDRYFEWMDIVANTVGCTGGLLIFMLIFGKELSR